MAENTVQTKKLRLNIIDFLIIIVLIGAAVGIALRAGVIERVTNQSNLEEAKISFLIQDIQESSADLRGTVVGVGTFTDEGFLLAGINFIAPGATVHIQSSDLDVNVTITGVERVNKAS